MVSKPPAWNTGRYTVAPVVIWVFHLTVRPERVAMRAVMQPEADSGVITPAELDALAGGWKQRRAYRRSAHTGRRLRHHRLEAAHDLADQLAASAGTETDRVHFARAELARLNAPADVVGAPAG